MPRVTEKPEFFMKRACALALKGRRSAQPNPWVGCVIVSNGEIVGEGYHVAPGEPHAEINALREAKARAKGATAYVTLEPCSHFGRTPPCVDALIEAKISHVVIAQLDPDPRVNGKGMERLQKAGIQVTLGILEKRAREDLLPYLFHRTHHRPYVTLKAALSLDGKMAAIDQSSKWITREKARIDAHRLRAQSSAILVGTKTALLDHPKLNVRLKGINSSPLRIVLDRQGIIPLDNPLFDSNLGKTLLVTSTKTAFEKIEKWRCHHMDVITVDEKEGRLDLSSLLSQLGERGIIDLLVEGGPTLIEQFMKDNLANRLLLYVAPTFLGKMAPSFSWPYSPTTIREAHYFKLRSLRKIEEDIRLELTL